MSASNLLRDLRELDIHLSTSGDRLHVNSPQGVLTEKLRASILHHKVELMELLEGAAGSSPDAEAVASMSAETFAQANLIVRVYSSVLEDDVLFVSDNVRSDQLSNTGLTVYRAAELMKLGPMVARPRTLQIIHQIKSCFGGSIRAATAESVGEPTKTPLSSGTSNSIAQPLDGPRRSS